MGFEVDSKERETPKLPLFSIAFKRASKTTPSLPTPPVNLVVSVPFLWEEAPGKPRVFDENKSQDSKQKDGEEEGVVRCLELPPRLALSPANKPCPTKVLDGPTDISCRSLSLTKRSERGKFNFSRFKNDRCCDGGGGGGGGTTVKISRVTKNGSLLNLSQSKSRFLEKVYKRFKQVIPWKRKQENLPRISLN